MQPRTERGRRYHSLIEEKNEQTYYFCLVQRVAGADLERAFGGDVGGGRLGGRWVQADMMN